MYGLDICIVDIFFGFRESYTTKVTTITKEFETPEVI